MSGSISTSAGTIGCTLEIEYVRVGADGPADPITISLSGRVLNR